MLSEEDIKKLQSIKVPETNDFPWFSRKNTTTHQCCEKFSDPEKQIITEISEKVRLKYEKQIGKTLYYMSDNRATIYVYYGKDSQHLWHVDPQNLEEIFNVIICFKKVGGISPLQCKNKEGEAYSVHFEEGDAALFNGGTTVHQVPPNEDDKSERTVLSIAFTTNENFNDGDNLCTFIEGGSNYFNLIKIVLSIVTINLVLTFISGINTLSYTFLLIYIAVIMIIIKYVPLYLNTGLGSGRSSSFYHNFVIVLSFMLFTFSTKGAIVFISYFFLSDVFFPRSWVEYD